MPGFIRESGVEIIFPDGIVVGHAHDIIDDVEVEITRHKSGPEALNFLGRRQDPFACQDLSDDWRGIRFHGDGNKSGFSGLKR